MRSKSLTLRNKIRFLRNKTVIINNATDINQLNNNIAPQIIEHKQATEQLQFYTHIHACTHEESGNLTWIGTGIALVIQFVIKCRLGFVQMNVPGYLFLASSNEKARNIFQCYVLYIVCCPGINVFI